MSKDVVTTQFGPPLGSEKELKEHEIRLNNLASERTKNYLETASRLWDIKERRLYKHTCKTFEEYVEFHIANQTAPRARFLCEVWQWIVNELPDEQLRKQLEQLGWRKAVELKRVATKDDAEEWIKIAEKKSLSQLIEAIKAKKEEREPSDSHSIHFSFYDETKRKNVEEAIADAKERGKSNSNSDALAYIALKYLGTIIGKEALPDLLTSIEGLFGVYLIAINKNGQPIYSREDTWELLENIGEVRKNEPTEETEPTEPTEAKSEPESKAETKGR